MRRPVDAARIRRVLEALARAAEQELRIYLVGGATAVLTGWRGSTIDVDFTMRPEDDAVLRAIPALKERLRVNVELASPTDFIPVSPGWEERSPFVVRMGRVSFHHFDLVAQALAKIERGHRRDLVDVYAMLELGLVQRADLLREFARIEPALYRFPAIHAPAFRQAVEAVAHEARFEPGRRVVDEPVIDESSPPPPPPGEAPAPDVLAAAAAAIEQMLAEQPDATMEALNARLSALMGDYNDRAQAELGGLSPDAVHGLVVADWTAPGSAVQVRSTLTLAALGQASALQHARLLLEMLAEQEPMKMTTAGNLPRAFVHAFRARMLPTADSPDDDRIQPHVRNEEDVFPLHLSRVLLEVAGLVKQRRGMLTRTRAGAQLASPARAGALYAALLRAHFRRLNLAWLDGAAPAPGFQQTIAFTLYQFGQWGAEWREAAALADLLLLPALRTEIPPTHGWDPMVLVLETRCLRPLVRFGLAEVATSPRAAGDAIARSSYRKTPLFDLVFAFRTR